MTINYISNLDVKEYSGGWSGMNHHVYSQLESRYTLNLIDKVNPPYATADRIFSKLFRVSGLKGIFPAFTEGRLNRISNIVLAKMDKKANMNFFHGATPWINIRSHIPYAVYLDASFATYMNVYHQKGKFNDEQLQKLFHKERNFLSNAAAAFFSSTWAMEDAKKAYGIDGNNFHVVGLGGSLSIQLTKDVKKEKYFFFVGLDFLGKGGDKLVMAFLRVIIDYPDYHLKIVGQEPPAYCIEHESIEYVGLIDKNNAEGKNKLDELFSKAHCFVLPTNKDITPLVLVEAGSVGCPAISMNNFGIPEIVVNGETGILINSDKSIVDQLTIAMKKMCENNATHDFMSRNSIEYIRNNFTWDKVGERIRHVLNEVIHINVSYE